MNDVAIDLLHVLRLLFNLMRSFISLMIRYYLLESRRGKTKNENYPNKCPARPVEGLDESAN